MIRRGHVWATLAAVALTGVASPAARADLVPVNPPDVGGFEAGLGYKWTYTITLATGQFLAAGNWFVLNDFADYTGMSGFIPLNGTDGNWTLDDTLFTGYNLGGPIVDDPNVVNLNWNYSGVTVANVTGEPLVIGKLWAYSWSNQLSPRRNFFAASNQGPNESNGEAAPTDSEYNISQTYVPVPKVPEPGTLVLMGLGLPVLGACRALRRRRTAVA